MKKLTDFINRYAAVIEFILGVFFAFSVYELTIIKYYLGFFPLKYVLFAAFFIAFTVWTVYLQIKRNKTAFAKIFILFLIPVGMLYVFFVPPTVVPDEHAHMLKAYEVSTGRLVTEQPEDHAPEIFVPRFLESHELEQCTTYEQFNTLLKEKTDYNDMVADQTSAASYSFLSYIFSGFGFFIGRIFSINGLLAFYLARIFNYAFFIFAIYMSIKIIPIGKYTVAVVAFLPMVLQQAASLSADSMLDSCAVLFISMTLYIKNKPEPFSIWEKVIYTILSVFIIISKIAYLPLLGISLLLLKTENKDEKIKKRWGYLIINVIIAIGIGAFWYRFAQNYFAVDSFKEYFTAANVDSARQIDMIKSAPKHLHKAIEKFFLHDAGMLLNTIGLSLGWLNIDIGMGPVVGFLIMLAISPYFGAEKKALNILEKVWFWVITVSVYLIIGVGFYLTWTGVGADSIAGAQGRYFLPVLMLPFLASYNNRSSISYKHQECIFPLILAAFNIVVVYSISVNFF